jgi:PAS domain S-box-containing protein
MTAYDELMADLKRPPQWFSHELQRQCHIGSWIYLCDTGEYRWSDEVYRLYRLKKSEPLTGDLFLSKVHPEDLEMVCAAYDQVAKTGGYHVIHRAVVRDKVKWLEQTGRYYEGEQYGRPFLLGTVQEITRLKERQNRLEAREQDFAAINRYLSETTNTTELESIVASAKRTIRERMDVVMIGVFVRREGEIVRIIPKGTYNPQTFLFLDEKDYVGYEAIQTGTMQHCVIDTYKDEVCRETLRELGGHSVVSLPIRYEGKTVGALSIVLKKREGLDRRECSFCRTLCGYLSSQLNNALLYDRLKKELADRTRLETDMDLIFRESIDCIAIMDTEGRFSRVSPAFAAKLGHSVRRLTGQPVFDYVHPNDREYLRYIFRSLPQTGVARGICCRFQYPGGGIGYWESNLSYVQENQTTVAVARDITGMREVESRNLELEKTIAIERLKTSFLSNISHEFKTPLNVILSSADLIEKKLSMETEAPRLEEYERFLSFISQSSYRLLRLTLNLIDTSKIESEHVEPVFAPCQVKQLVETVVLGARPYAESRGIALRFDSPAPDGLILNCDGEKVERILLNLISNAIAHTPDQGCIEVILREKNEAVEISVKDTGTGITQEMLPCIFEKFTTEKSLSTGGTGSGIGLFIVKSLVEMHQGHVTVDSRVGEGSCFTFTLSRNLPISGRAEAAAYTSSARMELELSPLE